jgi:hypothetical protein
LRGAFGHERVVCRVGHSHTLTAIQLYLTFHISQLVGHLHCIAHAAMPYATLDCWRLQQEGFPAHETGAAVFVVRKFCEGGVEDARPEFKDVPVHSVMSVLELEGWLLVNSTTNGRASVMTTYLLHKPSSTGAVAPSLVPIHVLGAKRGGAPDTGCCVAL